MIVVVVTLVVLIMAGVAMLIVAAVQDQSLRQFRKLHNFYLSFPHQGVVDQVRDADLTSRKNLEKKVIPNLDESLGVDVSGGCIVS